MTKSIAKSDNPGFIRWQLHSLDVTAETPYLITFNRINYENRNSAIG